MAGPSDVVDPSSISGSGYSQTYPTPPPMSDDGRETSTPAPEQSSKKKRKAWGQPVPEIKQILPPRKRAKTAEEKEQRKNERILRNRRAADKSRQRQKAAVADLEVRQVRIEKENAALREILSRYQARFGVQEDFPAPLPTEAPLVDLNSAPSPLDLEGNGTPAPFTPSSFDDNDAESVQPTLVQGDDLAPMKNESPVLAPQLNLIHEHSEATQTSSGSMASLPGFPNVSGLTQYPAVVLCDLQCQPETWAISMPTLASAKANLGISYLLQVFQTLTIFHSFSTTTLLPMCQLFQILAQRLSMTSTEQDFSSILTNFPLIHSLISMPSTPTRPAVFRMKLLSRLLACSPHMARLLLTATDGALQQVVSEDGFAQDPERRWTWSSLMTIKWTILRLEREHRKIRRQVRETRIQDEKGVTELKVMAGVDLGAVARSSKLWQGNCTTRHDNSYNGWATAQEVH
ncbi:transcription factor that binds to CRE motif [Cladophialophora chaetospira]|uniref:Transcription factor that binds to CRE motif n=1 Tax=Cladophialophora chaetospira TaxID=386627 RepID=A0AA38X9U7_9EURO|nr:transcription factor that binds to CRE motif [Cladophialophora chaetospira]